MRVTAATLAFLAAIASCHPFASAADQDVIRMLVPGFAVRELPVRLPNVNTLRFGPDGRLYALGYDGRIHALRDADGDGLEDEAQAYWDRPTLRVPVGMAWGADGLYVSSQGKVSVLRDTDTDGRADDERVLATGWPKTDVASGGVDATAVTLDPKGNVYFGLLCANFANAYRLKDGRSEYDRHGERGTIQKMAADGTGRVTLATGIRVPYALAFNREGDLFLTDQEGETWLPGGNPLDELNHVVAGRHYGFPPRHDTHLPDVVDEPPVVGFGPQHQSTCGLVFNDPSERQARFGPAWWEGNALVAGFSRGKIWRVTLAKTPEGYAGHETLIASAGMMVADLAISAQGELYVACHSGQPDWGTGPKGQGKLYKITYVDGGVPQPVAAWAAGPEQVQVAFDRPVDPADVAGLEANIEFGPSVRAADRFEVLRPGYKTVKHQQAERRGNLRVRSHRLSADGRTLILTTDPHPQRAHYAVSLGGLVGKDGGRHAIDLAYELAGVRARRSAENSEKTDDAYSWLPHLSTDVSLALLAGTAQERRLAEQLTERGVLTLEARLDLPDGTRRIRLEANDAFAATAAGERRASGGEGASHVLEFDVPMSREPIPVSVALKTGPGGGGAALRLTYVRGTGDEYRPLPPRRVLVPWAPAAPTTMPSGGEAAPAGGDAERGRLLFTDQLKCATCHQSKGRELGPDLSNLQHRDPAAILRDVTQPSAAINPDYVAYHLKLRGGRTLHGFVQAEGDEAVRVVGPDQATDVPRDQILEMRPSGISLMPEGLLAGLSDRETRDLLAFLMTPAPAAPDAAPNPTTKPASAPASQPTRGAPPARTAADVRAMLGAAPARRAEPLRPLRITLVAGPKDHGPGEHDYPAWQKSWAELLGRAEAVTVSTAWQWPDREQLEGADVLMFNCWNHDWSPRRYEDLDRYLARGGGIVVIHAACIADTDPESLAKRTGLAAQPKRTKYRHGPLELTVNAAAADHPVTRGFRAARFVDETYWPMIGDPKGVTVLATANEEGRPRPMLWTFESGRGRVFGSVLGHYTWTTDDPLFRALVLRGTAWAAKEDVRRLEPLVVDAEPGE